METTEEKLEYTSPSIKLSCEYGLMEALGYIIIWIIISVFTFGIGAFFAIYYFYKAVIGKTYVVNREGKTVGRLECQIEFAEIVGHIVIWVVLTVITLGIAAFFYIFTTLRLCMNKTIVVNN